MKLQFWSGIVLFLCSFSRMEAQSTWFELVETGTTYETSLFSRTRSETNSGASIHLQGKNPYAKFDLPGIGWNEPYGTPMYFDQATGGVLFSDFWWKEKGEVLFVVFRLKRKEGAGPIAIIERTLQVYNRSGQLLGDLVLNK